MNKDLNNLYFLLNMSVGSSLNTEDLQLSHVAKKRKLYKIFSSYFFSAQDTADPVLHYGNSGVNTNLPHPFRKLKSHEST